MTKIVWAFLSIAGGFVTMAVLIGFATFLLNRTVPEWTAERSASKRTYLVVNIGYTIVAALAGGYITTWIARENQFVHLLALALVTLLLGALSALQMRGKQPVLYQLLLAALTPMAVVAGGFLRLRVMGIL